LLRLYRSNASTSKSKAASLALLVTVILSLLKLFVAIVTGSVGVLSEAIHSGLDLVSSLLTFFVVRAAVRPADWDHPFGHGKLENLSALFEALLLIIAAVYIFYEGVLAWAYPHSVQHLSWALVVIGFSAVANLFVYYQNLKVAKTEESIALETNSYHFLADFYSSLGIFIGLGVLKWTGLLWVDALLAVLIAVYVLFVALMQIKKSIAELSDMVLPEAEVLFIQSVLSQHQSRYLNYHDLKTRKAGAVRYVELHLTVCSDQSVKQAHLVCDIIEEDLMKHFKDAQVNIHIEPCDNHDIPCIKDCRFLNQPRSVGKLG